MLDKEKELASQREREAAEACEKERQANVRLQLAETLLKKKTEEHRQLVHECQLKENQVIFELFSIQSITDPGETIKRKKENNSFCLLQWAHTIRRRDQENHRLHQQLLKFLRTKPTSGNNTTGMIPLEVEIRGSLAPPQIAGVSRSETPTRRKQWDRTADDSRKWALSKYKKNRFFLFKPPTKNTVYSRKRLVEVKWKSALNSLEKDHQLLRADYLQLVDMVGQFLANCSTKMLIRSATNPLNSNIAVLAAFYSSDGTWAITY